MHSASGRRVGRYIVLELLGTGGMGEVYRARDAALNRDVALKILPEAFASDPKRRVRFDREAQFLASLNHPHIAQIYEGVYTPRSEAGLTFDIDPRSHRFLMLTQNRRRTVAEVGAPGD